MPPVRCSWYQYFSDVTEGDVLANLDAMGSLDLPVGVVQIDDGYEACVGDWLTSSGRFSDLPGVVSRIRAAGRHLDRTVARRHVKPAVRGASGLGGTRSCFR